MSETQNNTQEQVQESVQNPVQENAQQNVQFNPFSDNAWSDSPLQQQETTQTETAPASSPDTQEEYEEEIVDADEWLKGQFGSIVVED